jgi:hypothetical protein
MLASQPRSYYCSVVDAVEKSSDFGDYGIRIIQEIRDGHQHREP